MAYSANMANLVNSVGLNLIDAYDRLVLSYIVGSKLSTH